MSSKLNLKACIIGFLTVKTVWKNVFEFRRMML